MSMIGCFSALKDEDLSAILSEPKRMRMLWGPPPSLPKPGFIARLFGAKEPEAITLWQPSAPVEDLDVDKAWPGIHFLLTGSDLEGDGPLAFVLCGGDEIDEDMGYGPARGFSSSKVVEIAEALKQVDPDALYEKADPKTFEEKEIYPEIWEESKEDCIGYVIEHLKEILNRLGCQR